MGSPDYFDGKWKIVSIETRNGESLQPDFETLYSYLPPDKHMTINRDKFKTDCFYTLFCLSGKYGVEHLSSNECLLYSLADMESDPDDSLFRIKMKRTEPEKSAPQ